MKKLLIVTNHSYMLYRFRRELIQELQREYEVVISTPFVGHEEDFAAMGCKMVETQVDRRGKNPLTELRLILSYRKLLRAEQPDMVITYSIKPNIYAGTACRKQKIPYCINIQGLGTAFQKPPTAAVATFLYRRACKGAKAVFFENEESAKLFIDRKIVKAEKITVLKGAGINTEYYAYQPQKAHEEKRFLYLGRIMKEKGIDELLAAFCRLKEVYGDKATLDLVGFYEDDYKEKIESLERDGAVRFLGFKEDPRPYYASADAVVLPSYHEGMSNVLLEAASTGRVIAASDIPGCREAIADGKTGFLFQVKNADSLYAALEKVMQASFSELEEMGRQGREKMCREFAKEAVVKETAEKIRE